MLTKRQIEIIKKLNDEDKLTAQNLASSLHVSTKTIRNDICLKFEDSWMKKVISIITKEIVIREQNKNLVF